jgi:hypothetical protein
LTLQPWARQTATAVVGHASEVVTVIALSKKNDLMGELL